MSLSRCRTRAPDGAPVTRSVRLAGMSRKKVAVGLVSALSFTALAIPTSALATGTAPNLGTAAPFGVLASATVTNTSTALDPTIVGGDLGLYPGTSITGFPPGLVLGTIHDTDGVAQGAQADSLAAYNYVAGEAVDTIIKQPDLAGLTLVPGVYANSASAVSLNGALTLDGQGDPNSVFIFQVGSTLTTGTGSTINYTNGASPCNVFWQVGSSATLGTGSTFVGTILANTSISLDANVTVLGRLLAGDPTITGAVTLISDSINPSDCTPATIVGSGGRRHRRHRRHGRHRHRRHGWHRRHRHRRHGWHRRHRRHRRHGYSGHDPSGHVRSGRRTGHSDSGRHTGHESGHHPDARDTGRIQEGENRQAAPGADRQAA